MWFRPEEEFIRLLQDLQQAQQLPGFSGMLMPQTLTSDPFPQPHPQRSGLAAWGDHPPRTLEFHTTLPREHLRLYLRSLRTGEEGWIPLQALVVDVNGKGWLDGEQQCNPRCTRDTPIRVRKDEGGFLVDLSRLSNFTMIKVVDENNPPELRDGFMTEGVFLLERDPTDYLRRNARREWQEPVLGFYW